MLRSNKLSTDDINTIWTDTVVRFSALVRNGKYQHQGNITGYLYNLSRFIMLNYLKSKKRSSLSSIEEMDFASEEVTEFGLYSVELKDLLSKELSRLGEMCQKILQLWSMSFSMKEIKKKLDIISVEALRKRKHICLKKLLMNVNKNEGLKSNLRSYLDI